jgi:hypothetical protein
MAHDIRSVTPTVCKLMGIAPPDISSAPELEDVVREISSRAEIPVQRCLIFAADAIGKHPLALLPRGYERLKTIAPITVELQSMTPSITPVCFSSMLTGALPDVHGIQKSERPVLTCPTIFDAASSAGKRVAIVAVTGSSIDRMYKDREVDYYSEPYDPEVVDRTTELISEDRADFIVSYVQAYDDRMHKTTPSDPAAISAMRSNIEAFERLVGVVRQGWSGYSRLIAFTPDHGVHLNPETGHGTHGSDMPEDLEVVHFYAAFPAEKP